MIEIVKDDIYLLLKYKPYNSDEWLKEIIQNGDEIIIKGKFTFSKNDYVKKDEYENHVFVLGKLDKNYYVINKEILSTAFEVYIDKEYKINYKAFEVGLKNKNTFSAINNVYEGTKLFIGGENADITSEEFEEILKLFPTQHEKDLY